jgi:hypothetical protein
MAGLPDAEPERPVEAGNGEFHAQEAFFRKDLPFIQRQSATSSYHFMSS